MTLGASRITLKIFAALALILAWTLLVRPHFSLALHSDSLYIDDLWRSFFDGRGLKAWSLPPGPSFIPDLPLYALSTLAGQDLGLRHALYALLQAALIWAGLALCARRYFVLAWPEAMLGALTGLSFFVLLLTDQSGLSDLFQPTHHGGSVAAMLWILALAPDRERPGYFALALWALALACLIFSDKSLLAWAILPLMVMQAMQGRLYAKWVVAVLLGLGIASLAATWMREHGGPRVSSFNTEYFLQHVPELLRGGFGSLADSLKAAPALGLIALLWFGWVSWQAGAGLACFFLLSALSTVFLGALVGGISGRHLFPLYFSPAAFLPLWLFQRVRGAGPILALTCLACMALLCASMGLPSLDALRAPYPSEVSALEDALGRPDQVSGYAEYWQCRRFRMLSRRGLWLDPAGTELSADGRLKNYFFISNSAMRPTPHFYVIMKGLEPKGVEKAFGKPQLEQDIGGFEVWFYRPDRDLKL